MVGETGSPIGRTALLETMAKASVPSNQLPGLLGIAQEQLDPERLHREYECVAETDGIAYFLVPSGWWDERGKEWGFDERERDAVRRAHATQLRRRGRQLDRTEEFESALEIREAVVVRG